MIEAPRIVPTELSDADLMAKIDLIAPYLESWSADLSELVEQHRIHGDALAHRSDALLELQAKCREVAELHLALVAEAAARGLGPRVQ